MHQVAAPAAQLPAPANRVYVRPEKPPAKRCLVVGFCESSRSATPYDDTDVSIWGLNKAYIFMPRLDRFFEMHSPAIYNWEIRRPNKHIDWMKQYPGEIIQHVADPAFPNSIAYPLQEVSDFIGRNIWRIVEMGKPLVTAGKDPYLTSSIALEIALAMYEGFETIELYGVDLNTGGEYAWQKAGVEYLLGMAAGMGIKIILPGNCPLLHGEIYGRGFLKPEGESITVPQLETRMAELQKKMAKVTEQYHQCTGALMEAKFTMEQMPPGIDAEKQDHRIKALSQQQKQLEASALQTQGAIQEVGYAISTTPQGQPGDQAIAQIEAGQSTSAITAIGIDGNGHEQTVEAELVAVA